MDQTNFPSNQPDFGANQDTADYVAYLDGELEPHLKSDVESRLAADAQFRQRLQQLEKAWSMLDDLPRVSVDETFTKSTVEIFRFVGK